MGLFGIWILALLSSCRTFFPLPPEEKSISNVKTWAYQLQKIDLSQIEKSSYDLVVMDYSRDGSEEGMWSFGEIRRLRESSSGKILLAYLSIGKAETHRSYWEGSWVPGNPPWLGKAVEARDGRPPRFNVKYWEPNWKEILKNWLDRIVSQGYNGVLLDGCDVYTYWSDDRNGEAEVLNREDAAIRMVDLILELASYGRNRVPDFIVCTQERTKLYDSIPDPPKRAEYLRTIQGAVGEGIFYPGEAAEDAPYNVQSDLLTYFRDFRSRGKIVFSLEYLSQVNIDALDRYFRDAKAYGFLPFAANRALDTLRTP